MESTAPHCPYGFNSCAPDDCGKADQCLAIAERRRIERDARGAQGRLSRCQLRPLDETLSAFTVLKDEFARENVNFA